MNWGYYISLFLTSTIKFMFAPLGGIPFKLSFIETYVACCAGAIFSSAIFYFSASYFMHRAREKKHKLRLEALEKGEVFVEKKKFTRMNKFIVRMKMSIGIVGISFWAPFFLSIPLGSIIVAKFYGERGHTYPLILVGIFLNGLITTSLVYLFQ